MLGTYKGENLIVHASWKAVQEMTRCALPEHTERHQTIAQVKGSAHLVQMPRMQLDPHVMNKT